MISSTKFLLTAATLATVPGSFTMTTRPPAIAIINSTSTGQLVTTRGHLAAIQYATVNGVQVVTVTVTP